jgi:predicted MFS family arabinose efflux permease
MSMRVLDPVVPEVARDLAVSAATVALLASAFTFPYALSQPLLGALGDATGKARIIKLTLAVLVLSLAAAAVAPSIEALFIVRVIGGIAGGGIIPLAFAMVGDRFDMDNRQWALSRLLMAIIAGQMTGSLGSGLLASALGWRASMFAATGLSALALALTVIQLRPRPKADRAPFSWRRLSHGYGEVFGNPRAIVCFAAVFAEGIVIFGVIPYVAVLLEQRGEGGLREAGFVLAGFAIGGFSYVALVRFMLKRLGQMNVIRLGAAISATGFAALALHVSWPVETLVFFVIGIGFYMIHNSLQTQATELAPGNRGSAVAAHAFFFFIGQGTGPILFGLGFSTIGSQDTLLAAALLMAVTGVLTAAGLEARSRSTL